MFPRERLGLRLSRPWHQCISSLLLQPPSSIVQLIDSHSKIWSHLTRIWSPLPTLLRFLFNTTSAVTMGFSCLLRLSSPQNVYCCHVTSKISLPRVFISRLEWQPHVLKIKLFLTLFLFTYLPELRSAIPNISAPGSFFLNWDQWFSKCIPLVHFSLTD